jgi:uncharacterized protein YndB with AHSA1/START domain
MAESPDQSKITKTAAIDAPPSRVWFVLTKSDMIEQWMYEEELTVISEWRVGGTIHIRMAELS